MSELSPVPVSAGIPDTVDSTTIQSQVATAKQYPRDLAAVRRSINQMVADTKIAAQCVYQRPVGRDKNGNIVTAKGMSIRMAELLASCWGNLRFGAQIIDVGATMVRARAFAWDLETNIAAATETVEPCVDSQGRPYTERQRQVIAKAAAKKALRDAILSVIPRAISEPVYRACLERLEEKAKVRPAGNELGRIRSALASLGVSDDRVFAVLGVNSWEEVNEAHLAQLSAAILAIEDDETTPELAFPMVKPTAPQAPPPQPAEPTPDEQAKASEAKLLETKLSIIRRHLKSAKIRESDWLDAAAELGIAIKGETLESLISRAWEKVSREAAMIDAKAREAQKGGGQ